LFWLFPFWCLLFCSLKQVENIFHIFFILIFFIESRDMHMFFRIIKILLWKAKNMYNTYVYKRFQIGIFIKYSFILPGYSQVKHFCNSKMWNVLILNIFISFPLNWHHYRFSGGNKRKKKFIQRIKLLQVFFW
jgi:hypothetical protein